MLSRRSGKKSKLVRHLIREVRLMVRKVRHMISQVKSCGHGRSGKWTWRSVMWSSRSDM